MRRKPLARSPMKRGTVRLERRAPMNRGRRRVGQAAAERRAAGGKRAVGRQSLPVAEYRALVQSILQADHGCAICYWIEQAHGFGSKEFDTHHVKKASAGGADEKSNLLGLCRIHHDATDRSRGKGRITIASVYAEAFQITMPGDVVWLYDRYLQECWRPTTEVTA